MRLLFVFFSQENNFRALEILHINKKNNTKTLAILRNLGIDFERNKNKIKEIFKGDTDHIK